MAGHIGIAVPSCPWRIAGAAMSQEEAEESVQLSPRLHKENNMRLPSVISGTLNPAFCRAEVPQSPGPKQVYSSLWCCVCTIGSLVGYGVGVGIKLSCWGWTVWVQHDKQVARGWCTHRGEEISDLCC